MSSFFNEFTGTHDVAITTGNSGAGGSTAATAVTSGIYFSTARSVVGSSSARIDGTLGSTVTLRYALGGVRKVAARMYVYLTAVDFDILTFAHATDTTAFNVRLVSTGTLRFLQKGGVTVWTSTSPLPLNQWVRVELYVQQGTAANDGSAQIAYYLGNSTTPVEAPSTFTGLNLGGDLGALTQMRAGKTSTPAASQFWLDSLAWNTDSDATGLIGPPVNSAPTVDAGTNQNVTSGATVGLSATASDTDGSISGYSWSFVYPTSGAPTLTGATTQTPSFTAGAAGSLYVLQCQVTDNGGATATDTVEIRVPKSTDFATLPMDGVAVGAWTRAGAASTDGAALADSDDSTYTESPDFTASTQTEEYRLEPIVARDSLTFTVRGLQTAAGGTTQVSLVEGATVRQTWTITPGTSAGNSTLTVTNPSAIVDWGNLRLRFSVVS